MKESLWSTSGKSLPWLRRLVAAKVSVAKSVDYLSDCRIVKEKLHDMRHDVRIFYSYLTHMSLFESM
jgi:hypothetical protein